MRIPSSAIATLAITVTAAVAPDVRADDVPAPRAVHYQAEAGTGVPWFAGDQTLSFTVGAELAAWRLAVLLRVQLPQTLSEVARSSVFENGKDLEVRWHGETALVFRQRPSATLGLDVQVAVGYERFDLTSASAAGMTTTTSNGFATVGAGWVLKPSPRTYLRPGVSVVFLFGGGGDRRIGDVDTGYKTLFVNPELAFGASF